MPAINVQRSIVINAPSEQVFDYLADFTQWPVWSPWLCSEKEAKLTYSDQQSAVGSGYSWDGSVVGAGEMKHAHLDRPNTIVDDLTFLKPWKSTADVRFNLTPENDGTKVTWTMASSLPFFMFWMKSNMETFIGMDYERGLKMLKEQLETGAVLSDCQPEGIVDLDAMSVLGKRTSCAMQDIGPSMDKAYQDIHGALGEGNPLCGSEGAAVYHHMDLKTKRFDFTTGLIVPGGSENGSLARVDIPAGRWLHVRHVGSYENLGNAWSTAFAYQRAKKLKSAKRPCLEIYRNHPEHTPPPELITDVYIPVK